MKRRNEGARPLVTSIVSDDLWSRIEPILDEFDPPKATGRKRIDQRGALDAIVYRTVTGCRWNQLPKLFPDDSSVHRTYQRWMRLGVLDRVWPILLAGHEELGELDRREQQDRRATDKVDACSA